MQDAARVQAVDAATGAIIHLYRVEDTATINSTEVLVNTVHTTGRYVLKGRNVYLKRNLAMEIGKLLSLIVSWPNQFSSIHTDSNLVGRLVV
jgi:hypothetical protein